MKLRQIFLVPLLVSAELFAGEYLDINMSPATDSISKGDTAVFSLGFTPKNGFDADVDLYTTCGSLSQTTIIPPVGSKSVILSVASSDLGITADTIDTLISITVTGKNGTTLLDSAECYIHYGYVYIEPVYDYEWISYTTADGLADNDVRAIVIDREGNKWFGTGRGVSKFDGTTWTTYTSIDGLVGNGVYAIAIDSEGNKWFGTHGGLSKFDGQFWSTYIHTTNYLFDVNVTAIAVDPDGDVWCIYYYWTDDAHATREDKIIKYDGISWTTYDASYRLAQNGVMAIDNEGNKWFANYSLGVSKLHWTNTSWTTYDTSDGLIYNLIRAIAVDNEGNIWFGGGDPYGRGGVSKFDGTNWTTYTELDGMVSNDLRAIAIDSEGNKWFGTTGGVSKFGNGIWTNIDTSDGLISNFISSISIDSGGNKWFGTFNAGVSMLLDSTVSAAANKDSKDISHQPNPFFSISNSGQNLLINYNTKYSGNVTFSLYDLLGKCVLQVSNKKSAGEQRIIFNTAGIPNGSYILKIGADDSYISKRIMIMK